MKLNRYKIIAASLVLGLFTMGCEDYLEEENNEALGLDNVATDPAIFDQLVASVYERARETTTRYTGDLYYVLEDLGTDIVTRGTALTGTDEINDYVNLTGRNWPVDVYWGNQYRVIAAANVAIEAASITEDVPQAELSNGIAEAKFFRALAYFKLVENFGGVPIITNQVTTAEISYPRASEEEVYAQIVQDLNEALADLPETTDTFGRLTKDAVRQFTARVLLTRGYKSFGSSSDFQTAVSLSETVIANHPLVDSFESLVSEENQRNSEVVFSYLFGSNSVSRGWGNSRHMLYKFRYFDYPGLLRGDKYQKGLGAAPTEFFYSLFEDDDERADASFRRVIVADEDYESTVNGATVNVMAGDTAIYFPKVAWTQAEMDAVPYKVINPGTYFENNGITVVHYPMFKKFDDPGVPFTQPDQSSQGERDMVVMRSGEAYLIAAEAYLQLNDAASAATLLTTLRSRAGLTTAVTAAEVDLDYILDERARELAGEANRWMDLKRTGKLIERTLANNPHAALNGALEQKHLLRPIPQAEIDNSGGSITQNPGYE
jgi:hypothetical protein